MPSHPDISTTISPLNTHSRANLSALFCIMVEVGFSQSNFLRESHGRLEFDRVLHEIRGWDSNHVVKRGPLNINGSLDPVFFPRPRPPPSPPPNPRPGPLPPRPSGPTPPPSPHRRATMRLVIHLSTPNSNFGSNMQTVTVLECWFQRSINVRTKNPNLNCVSSKAR